MGEEGGATELPPSCMPLDTRCSPVHSAGRAVIQMQVQPARVTNCISFSVFYLHIPPRTR